MGVWVCVSSETVWFSTLIGQNIGSLCHRGSFQESWACDIYFQKWYKMVQNAAVEVRLSPDWMLKVEVSIGVLFRLEPQ